MADITSEVLQTANVYNYLVNNIEAEIDVFLKKPKQDFWNKSLESLPLFTIREIE